LILQLQHCWQELLQGAMASSRPLISAASGQQPLRQQPLRQQQHQVEGASGMAGRLWGATTAADSMQTLTLQQQQQQQQALMLQEEGSLP
jgi:hypothetical protein